MAGVGNDLQRQQHKPEARRSRQLSPSVESAEAVITGGRKTQTAGEWRRRDRVEALTIGWLKMPVLVV